MACRDLWSCSERPGVQPPCSPFLRGKCWFYCSQSRLITDEARTHTHVHTLPGWQNRGIPVLSRASSLQVHPWFPVWSETTGLPASQQGPFSFGEGLTWDIWESLCLPDHCLCTEPVSDNDTLETRRVENENRRSAVRLTGNPATGQTMQSVDWAKSTQAYMMTAWPILA